MFELFLKKIAPLEGKLHFFSYLKSKLLVRPDSLKLRTLLNVIYPQKRVVTKPAETVTKLKRQTFIYTKDGFLSKQIRYWNKNNIKLQIRANSYINSYGIPRTLTYLVQRDEIETIFQEIRDRFEPESSFNQKKSFDETYFGLENFNLGNQPITGCSGAVYTATLKAGKKGLNGNSKISKESEKAYKSKVASTEHLAIKVMFNYSILSDPASILLNMQRELLPLASNRIQDGGNPHLAAWKTSRPYLPSHPNIVEMYAAFVDKFPSDLPEAAHHFDAALPTEFGASNTLFVVMKRYHMTLEEYLSKHTPGPYTALLLLTQLLEGLVFLLRHQVAHRDLKPNNILLDLTHGVDRPILVLADFGNALVKNDLAQPILSSQPSLGGNIFYMAPEILKAADENQKGKLNFSRSDLWAAGALAYQLFGSPCPLEAENTKLPPPPSSMPAPIGALVVSMLHQNPNKRPSPTFAATVCQLILHCPPCNLPTDNASMLAWLMALTLNQSTEMPEQQLRETFLKRVHFESLRQSVSFVRAHSLSGSFF